MYLKIISNHPTKKNLPKITSTPKSSPTFFPQIFPLHIFCCRGDVMFSDNFFPIFSQKKTIPIHPCGTTTLTSGYDLSVSWAIDFWLAKVGRRDMGMPWMCQGPGWDSFPATELQKTTTTEPYQSTHLHSKFLESKNLRNHRCFLCFNLFRLNAYPNSGYHVVIWAMKKLLVWGTCIYIYIWDDKLPRYMVIIVHFKKWHISDPIDPHVSQLERSFRGSGVLCFFLAQGAPASKLTMGSLVFSEKSETRVGVDDLLRFRN